MHDYDNRKGDWLHSEGVHYCTAAAVDDTKVVV